MKNWYYHWFKIVDSTDSYYLVGPIGDDCMKNTSLTPNPTSNPDNWTDEYENCEAPSLNFNWQHLLVRYLFQYDWNQS